MKHSCKCFIVCFYRRVSECSKIKRKKTAGGDLRSESSWDHRRKNTDSLHMLALFGSFLLNAVGFLKWTCQLNSIYSLMSVIESSSIITASSMNLSLGYFKLFFRWLSASHSLFLDICTGRFRLFCSVGWLPSSTWWWVGFNSNNYVLLMFGDCVIVHLFRVEWSIDVDYKH